LKLVHEVKQDVGSRDGTRYTRRPMTNGN